MPGPIPMRSSELSRERDADRANRPKLTKGKSIPHVVPAVNLSWEPMVIRLYEAARNSGMAAYFEASDWAYFALLCSDLSDIRYQMQQGGRVSPVVYQTIMRELNSLGLTEGERRRIRIELEAEADDTTDEDTVAHVADYRAKLHDAAKRRKGA